MSILPFLSLGFLLGMVHATDADHVAAMSTVVAERKKLSSAAWAGTLWGLGHTAMVVLVGGAIVMFRLVVPEKLALGLELGVAAMLVALGARSIFARGGHHHARPSSNGARGALKSIGIGLVHGLAGSAGVALAVLAEVESPTAGVAYLGLFGVGTVIGMALVTAVLSVPFLLAGRRFAALSGRLGRVAGLASLAIGAALAYRICVVEHLFV